MLKVELDDLRNQYVLNIIADLRKMPWSHL